MVERTIDLGMEWWSSALASAGEPPSPDMWCQSITYSVNPTLRKG